MKKTILGTIALVALLTFTTVGTASAHYGRGGYWHGGGRSFVHINIAPPVAYYGPAYGGYYGGGAYVGVGGGYCAPAPAYYGHPRYYARPNYYSYNYHNGYGRAPYRDGGRAPYRGGGRGRR